MSKLPRQNILPHWPLTRTAPRDLERIMDGPDAGDVAVLEAQIEIGYHEYETYSAGPDPDDIALAEARVSTRKIRWQPPKPS